MKKELIHPAHLKISRLFTVLKVLSFVYAIWILWRITRPLLREPAFVQSLSRYWQRDLSGAATWQWASWTAWDFCLWLVLVAAIAYLWRAMRAFSTDNDFESLAGTWLLRGAWLLLIVQLLSLASRPLAGWIMTQHLPTELHYYRWDYFPNDVMSTMFCLVLLTFAYLHSWMAQISAENRSFV